MPLPPEWLVAWTQYAGLLVAVIAGVLALWKGPAIADAKIHQLRKSVP